MAIIYSYPTVVPTPGDLVLGTDVNRADKPTKNFTIQSIVDIVAGGAAGLGAVLKISSNAQDLTDPANPVNQPIENLTFINGTGSATFGSFIDGTMTIQNGTGTDFVSIESTDFVGNLTGIVKVGSSIAGAADGVVSNNVTAITQPANTSNTTIATTEFVQQELTGEDLDFRGDDTNVTGSVDLNSETLAIVGKTINLIKNINTDTTAGGTLLNLSLANDVTIADDLTVTDVLTVNGTTASNIIAGGLQVNNSGGAHTFRVKGQTIDNLINTNVGDTDAKDQVAIGKNAAIDGTRLDVAGLIQGTSIKSSGMLTAQAALSLTGGVNLPVGGYGLVNQVLTNASSPGATTSLVWTTPTVGTLTDVDAGIGIIINKDDAAEPIIAIRYQDELVNPASGALNFIDAATAGAPVLTDLMVFSDQENISTKTNVKKVTILDILDLDTSVEGTQYTLPVFATTTTLGDSIIKQDSGASAATVTGTLTITSTGTASKFIVDATKADANFRGVASEAKALEIDGGISPIDDVISYPATSGTVKVQSAAGTAVAFQDGASENLSIVYPVIGQVVSGTSIVSGTTVASISGGNLVLNTATSAALVAGATLSFAASVLDIYTSGGPVRMPSFIPSTVATGKYLTGFSTPAAIAGLVNANDSIIIGMEKLQTQITALPSGLDYLGTWDARDSISTGLTAAAETAANIVVLTVPNFNVLIGTVITGFVSGGNRTVTAVSSDFLSITFGGATEAWAINLSLTFTAPASASLSRGGKPDLINGTFVAGQYYVVAEAGTATPNGINTLPNEWKSGDWAIYGDATLGALRWQKLDNTSSIEGSGAANKIAKWTGPSTLGTGLISDNATVVTIGAGGTGNFLVEGTTTLGGSATTNTLISGDLKVNKELNLMEGIGLWDVTVDPDAFDYGSAGQVLTSGGSASTANTWTTPTIGTVTEVDSGTGLITSPVAGITETGSVAINYVGTSNAILATTAATEAILTTDQIWYNDVATAATPPATINKIKKAPISSLPFDQYTSWLIDADDASSEDAVTSGQEVVFTGTNGITTNHSEASGTHTVQIIGVADHVTGTGTALTLPVWNSGGTSIGDSMVSQNAATGTVLTVASATPTLVIDDTTALKGELRISRSLDATTYMSSGITTGAAASYGTHVFSQTDGTTPRAVLTLNASGGAVFEGNSDIDGYVTASRIAIGQGVVIPDGQLDILTSARRFLWAGDSLSVHSTDGTTSNTLSIYATNVTVQNGDLSARRKLFLYDNTGTSQRGFILFSSNDAASPSITKYAGINFVRTNETLRLGASNSALVTESTSFIIQNTGKIQGAAYGSGTFTGTEAYNLAVDSSGNIIETPSGGGGGGGGTAKGGTFSKLFTAGTAGTAVQAFTITRDSGAMTFDVWFTCDMANDTSIAKKYTIAKQFGDATKIFYNKIIDTGAGTGTTGGVAHDFDVSFDIKSAGSNTGMEANITPKGVASMVIGITIDLGIGANDATVVMNAS